MPITEQEIKDLLKAINYTPSPRNLSIWQKEYKDNYTIQVNFSTEEIDYASPVVLGDKTTSNFKNSENFVVLECVNRLLEKGYPPNSIELEHKWMVGRAEKGKLDILVKDSNGRSYLMIECKTKGKEFDSEYGKMRLNGGQLFTYFKQDANAKWLCLYTSENLNQKVRYKSEIIQVKNIFRTLGTVQEIYDIWDKQTKSTGIFEDDVKTYHVVSKTLRRKDIKKLRQEDSGIIYNQFLEILRHNVVSDKGNAFNKIFNLFLCKVCDENKNDDDELDFQWRRGDTLESLLNRLNSLYKKGMAQYLKKEITDYTEEDIGKLDNERIKKIFKELRLYKNQEFAFVEVYNEQSFNENASVVKEVIELLQNWQIRYTHKQQFLGDFFELLLNTGFKQESGQFFTPVPLVRFMLYCLPIEHIVKEKIERGETDFLPYVIDYACGSGHFLTEMMDVIQSKIINKIQEETLSPSQKKKYKHYSNGDFEWAEKFIYGIERDYRLAKTTKLACFLHGDGEAKIIHASGLAPFNSDSFEGILKCSNKSNEQFDILVANPPYAVEGFRSTVENGAEIFDLFGNIKEKGKEIEILFIERAAQLVKANGVVAIILPQNILDNNEKYKMARKLLLEYFKIKGIVILGRNAFAETGTRTAIFILKKRKNKFCLTNKEDYAKLAHQEGDLIVVNSGDKDNEKRFLGYTFSSKRGKEGIQISEDNMLYDHNNLLNPDKVNSYILKNIINKPVGKVVSNLRQYMDIVSFRDCFDWDEEEFQNVMNPKKRYKIFSREYRIVRLSTLVKESKIKIIRGKGIQKKDLHKHGDYECIHYGELYKYNSLIDKIDSKTNPNERDYTLSNIGDVLFPDSTTADAMGIAIARSLNKNDVVLGGGMIIVRTKNEFILGDYLAVLLNFFPIKSNLARWATGTNILHIGKSDIEKITIPLPPKKIQQECVDKYKRIDKRYLEAEFLKHDNATSVFENDKQNLFKSLCDYS